MKFANVAQPSHVLLRVVAGLLMLQHGGQKLFGWFGGSAGLPGEAVPLWSLMGFAGALELLGGSAVLLGAFTRPMAFLLSGEMAVAYFMAHQRTAPWPIQNHGELAVLFSFVFLFLATHGAGGWSVDGQRQRQRA